MCAYVLVFLWEYESNEEQFLTHDKLAATNARLCKHNLNNKR